MDVVWLEALNVRWCYVYAFVYVDAFVSGGVLFARLLLGDKIIGICK